MSRCPQTGVKPAQERKRVQTGGVTALKGDLQGVLTDQAHVLDPQLGGIQRFHPRQAAGRPSLASTLGTGARPSELLAAVDALVATFPLDHHFLALAVDVDLQRERVGVLQVPSA
jgi:hypothetical protein